MEITRLYRLLELITLLRSGRRYDAQSLSRELKVSRRTIFRDLNILTAAGIPYYFDEETGAYGIRQSFFLPAVNLTVDEAMALLLVTRKVIGQVPLPLFQQASRAAIKIESSLPTAITDHCGSALDHVDVRWPPTSDDPMLDEKFHTLRLAVEKQRKVLLVYESLYDAGNSHPLGKTIETAISPYRLVFIHRAWYVLGFSSLHNEVRTFKVSRIITVKILEEMFGARPEFSLEKYLGDAWVMIREDKKYNVELIFTPMVARNVAEVRWHKNQQCEFLEDGSLSFKVAVDGLNEISWWILGYGDKVSVAKPKLLAQKIKATAERMMRLYEKSDD
ncbi:MAG: YafY family protein [Phycisphaerae bacterium]